MYINAVRLVSSLLCVKAHGSHILLNVCTLILLSLAITHYFSSDTSTFSMYLPPLKHEEIIEHQHIYIYIYTYVYIYMLDHINLL